MASRIVFRTSRERGERSLPRTADLGGGDGLCALERARPFLGLAVQHDVLVGFDGFLDEVAGLEGERDALLLGHVGDDPVQIGFQHDVQAGLFGGNDDLRKKCITCAAPGSRARPISERHGGSRPRSEKDPKGISKMKKAAFGPPDKRGIKNKTIG
jgi:hypothetical protein